MHILEYHQQEFFNDLEQLKKSSKAAQERLSYVSLIEDIKTGGNFGITRKVFLDFENKEYFLLTYMLYVLLDQSIYEANLKGNFENIPNTDNDIPKFCGILSSYHNNLSPKILIAIASTYVNNTNENKLFTEFKILTDYMLDKFEQIITRYLSKTSAVSAMTYIFIDISLAMQYDNRNIIHPSKRVINQSFYKSCLEYLSSSSSRYRKEFVTND